MIDILICLDSSGNSEGPVIDGPEHEPVWSLYANDKPGEFWGEWEMTRHGQGMTYSEALRLVSGKFGTGHLMC